MESNGGGGRQANSQLEPARSLTKPRCGPQADPIASQVVTCGEHHHHHHDRRNGLGAEGGGGGYEEGRDGVRGKQAGGGGGEGYAEAAAALREEFEALGIRVGRSGPALPPRPGYGAAGAPCVVRANHCFVRLADEGLHYYDVTISPEPAGKGVSGEVMAKLVAEHQHTDLGGRLPTYDGWKSLFTAGKLPFDAKEFEVTTTLSGDGRVERRYKVVIEHVTAISLMQLRMLLAGYPTDIPAQALQVLDVVLRDFVSNERNDTGNAVVGTKDFTLGSKGWKGLYENIRPTQNDLSLIADMSSTVFIQPLLLIDLVQKILNKDILDRNLTIPEYVKLKKALMGVRIEVTHRGDARRRYRIAGLSLKSTNDLSFKSSLGTTKTVLDYFRERYNLELKYKFLPCLKVGSNQNPTHIPIEVCKIVPRQRYQKKVEGSQVSTVMKSTCQFSPEPEQSIRQHKGTKRANEFGKEIDYNYTRVEARVLPAPNLKYHDSGSQKMWSPMNGNWNMKDKKVVNGAKISNWACVNFCEDLSEDAVKQFCFKLAEMSRVTGVDLADLKLPIYIARPDQVEGDLHTCCKEAQNELRNQKIGLLLSILPDENGSLYGNVKRICETDIGLVSQCCRKSNVLKANAQIFANIAIKINAKAGGRNSVFDDIGASLPIVSNKPTIIFGAGVSHPDALDDTTPSIASVVASQDWHEVATYNGVFRAQGHRGELITGLEDIVKELLVAFQTEPDKRTEQLIFYRDGVSEGQFKQVLEKEIPEIEKAWKALYNDVKPQITFIVVQKSHNTRLFPNNSKYKRHVADKGNVEPGTVVDMEMCHPEEYDFFLCSHGGGGVKGPSRPVHYHVLRDDNNFTADDLQSLTNNLCYISASSTCSLSIAAPAYYAHKLARRARLYATQGSDGEITATSGGAASPAGGPKPLPAIKDELKGSMFYC